jgi:F-box domain
MSFENLTDVLMEDCLSPSSLSFQISLENLSDDLVEECLSHLPLLDLLNVRRTSKALRVLVDEKADKLWEKQFLEVFGQPFDEANAHTPWKERFKQKFNSEKRLLSLKRKARELKEQSSVSSLEVVLHRGGAALRKELQNIEHIRSELGRLRHARYCRKEEPVLLIACPVLSSLSDDPLLVFVLRCPTTGSVKLLFKRGSLRPYGSTLTVWCLRLL